MEDENKEDLLKEKDIVDLTDEMDEELSNGMGDDEEDE